MTTNAFNATVGVNPGYFHGNEEFRAEAAVKAVAEKWQQIAEGEFILTECYVSAVFSPCVVTYREEWGCPAGGEVAVAIAGTRNPNFDGDETRYKNSVVNVLVAVAEYFNQSTTQVAFSDVGFAYITHLS